MSRLVLIFITLFLTHQAVKAQVAEPIASIKGGIFSISQSVVLSAATSDAVIRYTLDGSTPDSLLSPQYITPLNISKTTTLRAKAFVQGQVSSTIMTHTYFFNVNHSFPVVALSFNNDDFFSAEKGIYTNFTNGLEVPIHAEMFENDSNNTTVFSQLMGVEIQGTASASLPQKSLELKPKKAYGLDNIAYKVFPDLPFTSYKRLVLRNNGQDWGITMFREDFITSLASKTEDLPVVLKQPELYMSAYRPAVVYLNGQYWGIYSIKERMKTAFVEQRFNLKASGYDMLENENEVINGDSLEWLRLTNQLNSNWNFADNTVFEAQIKSKIDVQNFLDYNAFNVYIDNEDWPGNNVRRYRPRTANGKWRWISYDFDFTFGLFQVTGGFNTGDATPNSIKRLLDPSVQYFNNPTWSTLLFRRCMQNTQFRRDFINRSADMMNTIFKSDRVNQRLEQFRALYAPEVSTHTKRWGTPQPSIWAANLEKVKNFSNNRKANVIKHFDTQFEEVTGVAEVRLNILPTGAGAIQFNTITVNTNGWSGTYFTGLDIPVKAVPQPGYVFSRWEGKSLPATDSVGINLTDNLTLTAIFIPAGNDPCLTDMQAPTFNNCPLNIKLTSTGNCAIATWVAPTAADNCTTPSVLPNGVQVSTNFISGACFPIGATTVIYTATDARGNKAECRFNVTVEAAPIDPCSGDGQQPIFSNCPTEITLTTTENCAVATWVAPTATDNCTPSSDLPEGVKIASNFQSATCFPIGTTRVIYTATDAKNNKAECRFNVVVASTAQPCTRVKGSVVREIWTNVGGFDIGDLTSHPKFQSIADRSTILTELRAPYQQIENYYGSRVKAFLYPPISGNYTFHVFGDDEAVIFLNKSGSDPAGKERIAYCTTWTFQFEITKQPTQKSISILLEAGKEYYIEVLHKQGVGGDHFGVLWTLPNTSSPIIITSEHLAQYDNCATPVVDPCTKDTQAPIFNNCPTNAAATTTENCAIVTWAAPTATDNCTPPSVLPNGVQVSANFISGTCFPIGITTVIYTAVDTKNNKADCRFTVKVDKISASTNDIAIGIRSDATEFKKYTTLTFSITATNSGNTPMSNVVINFPYPTGTVNGGQVTMTAGSWSEYCAGGILCYKWTIPTVPANSSATLSIPLFVLNPPAPIIATATLQAATPTDANSNNNQASITITSQQSPFQGLGRNSNRLSQRVPIVVYSLSPNPTEYELAIFLESIIEKKVTFHFSNSLGKIIKTIPKDLVKGLNTVIFNVEDLQNGIYFVVPETNIGKNVPTKFVKM